MKNNILSLVRRWRNRTVGALFILVFATFPAMAHVSEQGLVLLLPTLLYITSGVVAVILTVVMIAFLPERKVVGLFTGKVLFTLRRFDLNGATSLAAFAIMMFLVYVGFNGSHDPLANPLPLFIWTIWWTGFVFAQGVLGDLWHWVNPWTGIYGLVRKWFGVGKFLSLPGWVGVWPGIVSLFGFVVFYLVDLSPDNPSRLATFVTLYWLYTFIGMLVFEGEQWLSHGECFTILLRAYARFSAFSINDWTLRVGMPGWRLTEVPVVPVSFGIFVLMVLASGSFDGLNETFWWLAKIGINPLEFPGRSGVVGPTLAGLAAANLLLPAVFALTVYVGLALVDETEKFKISFGRLCLAVLPIAFAYHFSHFLSAFLVNSQYALKAATDPFASGADFLGLGEFYVTTGFFNTSDTVKLIWLTQAGAVVFGHIVAVLLSHAIALDIFGNVRKAMLSQIPTAVFMVAYTLFGLWLLASPRGL